MTRLERELDDTLAHLGRVLQCADDLAQAVDAYRYARDDLSGAAPVVRADEAAKRYPAVVAALAAYQAVRRR